MKRKHLILAALALTLAVAGYSATKAKAQVKANDCCTGGACCNGGACCK